MVKTSFHEVVLRVYPPLTDHDKRFVLDLPDMVFLNPNLGPVDRAIIEACDGPDAKVSDRLLALYLAVKRWEEDTKYLEKDTEKA